MSAEMKTMILLGIVLGPFFSLMITPVFCFLRKLVYVPFAKKRYKEEAIRAGRVAVGTLVKHIPGLGGPDKLIYQYEYKGKQYRYDCFTSGYVNENINLYFMKNPRKATVASSLGLHESNWMKYYLVLSVICGIAVFFAGMWYLS